MLRTSEDICYLCLDNKAIKTNSHIIPAGLLKRSIGKRNKEQSFFIDSGNAIIDDYYGRENLNNNSEEIKQHHHARDFYFCPECEKRLGELENLIQPILTEKINSEKFKNQFNEGITEGGVVYKKILNISNKAYLVFFYSIIWRLDLLYKNDFNVFSLKNVEHERLREIIFLYLYERNPEELEKKIDTFSFVAITADSFNEESGNMAFTIEFADNPNWFYIYEFLLLFYSSDDDPSQDLLQQSLKTINSTSANSFIAIMPVERWNKYLQSFVRLGAERFLSNLCLKISNALNLPLEQCELLLRKEIDRLEDETGSDEFTKLSSQAAENIINFYTS